MDAPPRVCPPEGALFAFKPAKVPIISSPPGVCRPPPLPLQFNEDDPAQELAANPANLRLIVAKGNADGDCFDDAEEVQAAIWDYRRSVRLPWTSRLTRQSSWKLQEGISRVRIRDMDLLMEC